MECTRDGLGEKVLAALSGAEKFDAREAGEAAEQVRSTVVLFSGS